VLVSIVKVDIAAASSRTAVQQQPAAPECRLGDNVEL